METHSERIKSDHVSLFFIFDVHEGSANFAEDEFLKSVAHIKSVAKKRDVVTILGGDMIEAINVDDKRFSPTSLSPKYKLRDLKDLSRKQADAFLENIDPIRDTIVAALVGNHEETNIKYNHFDVYDYYCDALDCKKLGYAGIFNLFLASSPKNPHRKQIRIGLTHGHGGGGFREGYALNNCMDTFRFWRCDINIMGHVHKLEYAKYPYVTTNNNGKLIGRVAHYGIGGCFLKTYVEGNRAYFEGKKGPLSQIGFLQFDIDLTAVGYKIEGIKHEFDSV